MSYRVKPKPPIVADQIKFIIIDSFCGAGGWTEGVERAVNKWGNRIAVVVAGINHDSQAIASHAANHPETVHFVEDIRYKSLPRQILAVVQAARKRYPNALVLFHASLECTNFSNAKGGKSRDADSRSLAEYMPDYLRVIKPDLFTIENVREFMGWGPMIAKPDLKHTWEGYKAPACHMVFDRKKKEWDWHWIPESRTKGQYYQAWLQKVQSLGYQFDWKLLNAADFGAYTSRLRYFGIFAKKQVRIGWPAPTHSKEVRVRKTGQQCLFENLKPWKPVRDVLDFSDEGQSIFGRKFNKALRPQDRKDLVENSLERIYAGLVKHVAKGDTTFLNKCYTGNPENKNLSIHQPAGSITTVDHHQLVKASFIVQRQNNVKGRNPDGRIVSIEGPARTVTTTGGNQELVQAILQQTRAGNQDSQLYDHPHTYRDSATTEARLNLPQADFLANYYSGGGQTQDLDEPTTALTTVPKQRLITVEPIEGFLTNPGWYGHSTDLEKPAPTLVARQDKAPVSFIQCKTMLVNNQHQNVPTPTDHPAPALLTGNHQYLLNAQFTNSLRLPEEVSPTITADRHWPYLVVTESGELAIQILATDSPCTKKIKRFMAAYGIIDIKMRMLKIKELKRIQGFPEDYILRGSQTDQKKFIGNAVETHVAQKMIEALAILQS